MKIDWKFHKAQNDVLKALEEKYDNDLVVFRTGYGGGKSLLGSRWIIEKALDYERSDNLILAQDRSKGKATTYQVFYDEIPPADVNTNPDKGGSPLNSPIIKDFNASDLRLTTINNSSIRLGSADRWNRYAGAEFSAIWCDEVAHYSHTDLYDLYEMLISRQRSKGLNKMLWTSTGNGYNQFFDITEKRIDKEGEDLVWKDRMKVIVASSRDNPWLEELDKLERTFAGTEKEIQAIKGGFAKPQGLVYNNFTRNYHTVDPSKFTYDRFIYGYDHGWNDPRVILQIGITHDGRFVVVDEFYKEETSIEDAIDWLIDNNKPKGFMGAEHMGEHIKKFRKAGYNAVKAKKDLDEGIDYVRSRLEVNNGNAGLLIGYNCRNTIQEFLGYEEDDVGKSGAIDHALDSLRYALFTYSTKSRGDSEASIGVEYL